MTLRVLTASAMLALPLTLSGAPQSWKNTAPESFKANGQINGVAGGAASAMLIKIDRYSGDADHDTLAAALKDGGNDAFVGALKKAEQVGSLTMGTRTVPIRWARMKPIDDHHRRVAAATDQPVFFAGAGAADAKATTGFDIAVIEFTVDSTGLGKGTMAPAARVKAGGPTGVEVEDYSGKRIDLVTVSRILSRPK